jgi:hypothetical protein
LRLTDSKDLENRRHQEHSAASCCPSTFDGKNVKALLIFNILFYFIKKYKIEKKISFITNIEGTAS